MKKYLAIDYFKPNESFFIHLLNESVKEYCVYHTHDFVELCYVYSGKGFHVVNGKEYHVKRGDFFIINYDVAHVFYKESTNEDLFVYSIVFKPVFFDDVLINFNDFNYLTLSYMFKDMDEPIAKPDLHIPQEEQKVFDRLFENLLFEYNTRLPGHKTAIRAYMMELIIKVMRGFAKHSGQSREVSKNAIGIQALVDYLKANYSEQVSLSDLALKAFFSKNYLCKLFKETMGMTITEYTHNLRIEEACLLMKQKEMKTVDIAIQVGFGDYKSFFNAFKRCKGISPADYRKSV